MKIKSKAINLLIILALFSFFNWRCLKSSNPGIPEPVRTTIDSSGINKPELLKAIVHYIKPADSNKRKAMYWLLANMKGNYTVHYVVKDSSGHPYHFKPSKFKNYDALEKKWDSIEKIHGPLIYKADSFWMDQKHIKARFLIDNIDEAFKAYTTNPWDKSYNFKQFCEWILPYRCANETVEPFRKHFIKEYGPALDKHHPTNIMDVALLLNHLVNQKIHYKDTYNKEANVQTIRQLEHSGYGNFYDINIYKVKVLRAFGIAASLDYTPFLADTSFGYAWTTAFLPDSSEIRLQFPSKVNLEKPGRVAKIYRRTYKRIKTSLFVLKKINQPTPPFMGDYFYQDVTNKIASKTASIKSEKKVHYAYLAVFNDGGWHPVSWTIPSKYSVATFQRMGKDIVYLPVSLKKHKRFCIGAPFILNEQGKQHMLIPDFSSKQKVFLTKTSPYQRIKQEKRYTLYVWENNWKRLFSFIGTKKGIMAGVPKNGLFVLKNNALPRQERIFVVGQKGKQIFY